MRRWVAAALAAVFLFGGCIGDGGGTATRPSQSSDTPVQQSQPQGRTESAPITGTGAEVKRVRLAGGLWETTAEVRSQTEPLFNFIVEAHTGSGLCELLAIEIVEDGYWRGSSVLSVGTAFGCLAGLLTFDIDAPENARWGIALTPQ